MLLKEKADGIILVSAFPCGPDSMTNELLIRRIKGIPVLPLILDIQSGMAGIETRIESFLDIIRFQKGETV
jgi:predicted nucleotide-binding protein (sugar kinase/HSP70/actin superfamily)